MNDLEFLKKHLQNQNLIKHCIAVKAIMESLAVEFGENKEKWGTAGLLHDIDVDITKPEPEKHSLVGAELLAQNGYPADICQAVKVHNESHGIAPVTLIEKALFVTDPLSGLITAAALVLPSKKLSALEPKNIVNRFHEKSFAKGAKREIIGKCKELLDIDLEKFCEIGLHAMQNISNELGL
jgi:putative nucleotidyltransferase with HDIG domain